MKRSIIEWALLLALVLPVAGAVPALAGEIGFSGNATALFTGIDTAGTWDMTMQGILRLKLNGDISDSTAWQGEFSLSDSTMAGDTLDFQVDRLFLRWENGATRLTLGRQRIAWGVGYAFSPLDQFNPPNPVDPAAPRAGADALVLRQSLGDLSYATAVAVFPEIADGSFDNPAGGVILGTNYNGTDLSLSYLTDPAKAAHQWGLAAKGDLGLGWHVEGVYQKPWDTASPGKWLGVLGLDYSFFGGKVLLMAEYFYDETGEADPAKYDPMLLVPFGQRVTLGTEYLMTQASWQVDEFFGLSFSTLTNLTDKSSVLQPGANWQMGDNTRVNLGALIPVGDPGTETKLSGKDAAVTLQVKYSF